MRPYGRRREKQVRLTAFDNEPMARLAEQRLQQVSIPCIIRSLRGGPGLWGSAYNLPHDLYVFLSDEEQAREVLELGLLEPEEEGEQQASPKPNLGLLLLGALIGVLFLLLMVAVFSRPLG